MRDAVGVDARDLQLEIARHRCGRHLRRVLHSPARVPLHT